MPQDRYTTTVELEARSAFEAQVLARNAQVVAQPDYRVDDQASYLLRMSLAASIAHSYRARMVERTGQ